MSRRDRCIPVAQLRDRTFNRKCFVVENGCATRIKCPPRFPVRDAARTAGVVFEAIGSGARAWLDVRSISAR